MKDDSGSDIRIVSRCEERQCVHLRDPRRRTCNAFPDKIPDDIALGDNQHLLLYPGDHGIVYERRQAPVGGGQGSRPSSARQSEAIDMSSIFSTYSTGENRVTASILAVLKSLSLPRIERLLGALLEQSEFELVRFENQIAGDRSSVPDGLIASNLGILVETKIKRNLVREDQLRKHLAQLDDRKELIRLLLVLTPDDHRPAIISTVADDRVVWAAFTALDQAIDELLTDKTEVVSEREAFLLRELQSMMVAEGLLGSARDVVVVPARHAWREYQNYHAYVCQRNRTFQPVRRVAFYVQGEILPLVPLIREVHPEVLFETGIHRGALGLLVDTMLEQPERTHKEKGEYYEVFLLSAPQDPDTIKLSAPLRNDLTSSTGKPVAFTQSQRYVSLERLRTAKVTSDLVNS